MQGQYRINLRISTPSVVDRILDGLLLEVAGKYGEWGPDCRNRAGIETSETGEEASYAYSGMPRFLSFPHRLVRS